MLVGGVGSGFGEEWKLEGRACEVGDASASEK